MSYKLKYFYYFQSLKKIDYKVEILQNTDSEVTAEEIKGITPAFTVKFSELEKKYSPVFSSGAQINLLSESNLQFLSLYTADMQEFKVRFYKSIDSVYTLIWQGFLNSENYTEDFSQAFNYNVSFNCNDGFNLLTRIYFLDSDGSNYNTILSAWDILNIIFNKINLDYTSIAVKLSTSISGTTLNTGENIFHKTYLNCNNFYDEENQPLTCREILDNILQTHYANIRQYNGGLVITDNNIIFSGSSDFQIYDNEWQYLNTATIDLYAGNLYDHIKFQSTNQNMEVEAGINKQILTYSPYNLKSIIDFKADEDFSGSIITKNKSTGNYKWVENSYQTSSSWMKYNFSEFISIAGTGVENNYQKDAYLKIINGYYDGFTNYFNMSNLNFIYKKQLPLMIPSNYYLKFNMKVYPATKTNLGDPNENPKTELFSVILNVILKIGNKKWNINKWVDMDYKPMAGSTDNGNFSVNFMQPYVYKGGGSWDNGSNICDMWTDCKYYTYYQDGQIKTRDILIPLNGIQGGELSLFIYHYEVDHNYNGTCDISKINELRIKDVNISLVDSTGKELDSNDIEYTAFLNKNFKNKGNDIKSIIGTSIAKNPVERGAIMSYNNSAYSFIQNWTREGKTDIIENLLLRSVVSNYTYPSIKLGIDTQIVNNYLGYITYTGVLPDKKFLITSIINDYENEISELTLEEFNKDYLDINKAW